MTGKCQSKINMLRLQNLLEKNSSQGGQKDGAKCAMGGAVRFPTVSLHTMLTLATFALRLQVLMQCKLQAHSLGRYNPMQQVQRQGLQQQWPAAKVPDASLQEAAYFGGV